MLIDNARYLHPEKIFYTQTIFTQKDIDNNIKDLILGTAKGKFPQLNIFSYYNNTDDGIYALLSLENGKIYFNDFDIDLDMSYGDLVLFLSDIKYETKISDRMFKFSYNSKKEIFGTGNKMFEVIAKINDEYRIKVYADDEDSAIKQAYNIPIAEWQHPDLEPGLKDRQIIRHARWGNLSALEVKE
jgi:hypothetical protein